MLPLQIALGRNPEWADYPTVITKDDKPTSLITHASKKALAKQITIGSRYADALSLEPELRSTHIADSDLNSALEKIKEALYQFTPEIEPCPFDKESVWLNAKGLTLLFGTLLTWQTEVVHALKSLGFFCRISIGYTRMGTYIAARSQKSSMILESEKAEKIIVDEAPLSLVPLSLRSQKILKRLGITSLADLRALPLDGSIKRFGDELGQILSLFAKDRFIPIQYIDFRDDPEIGVNLDSPLFSLGLIIESLGPLIERAIAKAIHNGKEIGELELGFYFEDGSVGTESLVLAQPSLDFSKIIRLIELRLAKRQFREGLVRLLVLATELAPRRVQQSLFESREAELSLEKAFALIRARLGNEAIVVARLKSGHLPEHSYTLEPVHNLTKPESQPSSKKPVSVVRRIYDEPLLLSQGIRWDKVVSMPIFQSGSWWETGEKVREYKRRYLFYRNNQGEILWIYKDELTNAYWLQGVLD